MMYTTLSFWLFLSSDGFEGLLERCAHDQVHEPVSFYEAVNVLSAQQLAHLPPPALLVVVEMKSQQILLLLPDKRGSACGTERWQHRQQNVFVVDAPQQIQLVLWRAADDVLAHLFEGKPFLLFLMKWDWDEGRPCHLSSPISARFLHCLLLY